MKDLMTYTFHRDEICEEAGWEIGLFTSNDINGRCTSQRDCMELVLSELYAYDKMLISILNEYDLERILLDNNVYVQFLDSKEQ